VSNLEQIVRPSQTGDIRPAPSLALLQSPKVIDNPPHVWGSSGNSIFDLRAHLHAEVNNKQEGEITRKFDVVKVKNPDDSSQHVEVEVMTEYQSRNKISDERTKIRFEPPKKTSNTEIVSRGNTRTSTVGQGN
jgi:hypothetical protein